MSDAFSDLFCEGPGSGREEPAAGPWWAPLARRGNAYARLAARLTLWHERGFTAS